MATGFTRLLTTSDRLNEGSVAFAKPSAFTSGEALKKSGPVGFYWDLENCQISSAKSPFTFVQKLRVTFIRGGAEVEFVCVCDVTKERYDVINDLNQAQVSVVHVCATSKNAADEKLKAYLRKFGHNYKAPGTVVLISGDVNFSPELSDLRFRCGFDVVLIHGDQVSEALIATATRSFNFSQLLEDIPLKPLKPARNISCLLRVENLPHYVHLNKVRDRLRQLSDNCGGRVLSLNYVTRIGMIRFPNADATRRARKRMENEDVFGSKIHVRIVTRLKVPSSVSYNHQGSANWGNVDSRPISQQPFSANASVRGQDFGSLHHQEPSFCFRPINSSENSVATENKGAIDSEEEEDTTEDEELAELFPFDERMGFPEEKTGASVDRTREAYRILQGKSSEEEKREHNQALTDQLKKLLLNPPRRHQYHTTTTTSGSSREESPMVGLGASATKEKLSDGPDQFPVKLKVPCGVATGIGSNRRKMLGFGMFMDKTEQDTSSNSVAEEEFGAVSHSPEPSPTRGPFEIRVDNLDMGAQTQDIKRALTHAVSEVAKVSDVNIVPSGDGRSYALISVETFSDAKAGVEHLDKQKIGVKRVCATVESRSPTPGCGDNQLRKVVVDILNVQPSRAMEKMKFLDLLSVNQGQPMHNVDLYHLRDVVRLVESNAGTAYVRLNRKFVTDSPRASPVMTGDRGKVTESPKITPQKSTPRSPSNLPRPISQLSTETPFGTGMTAKFPTEANNESGVGGFFVWKQPLSSSPASSASRSATNSPVGSRTVSNNNFGWVSGEAVAEMIGSQPDMKIGLKDFLPAFQNYHGYDLRLEDYRCSTVQDLVEKLGGFVKIEKTHPEVVGLTENWKRSIRSQQIYYLFLKKPDMEMSVTQFEKGFLDNFASKVTTDDLKAKFPELLEWSQRPNGAIVVRLVGVQRFALKARKVLLSFGQEDVPLVVFDQQYERRCKEQILPPKFGYPSLMALIRAASNVLYIKGRGINSTVCINRNFLSALRQTKPDTRLPARFYQRYQTQNQTENVAEVGAVAEGGFGKFGREGSWDSPFMGNRAAGTGTGRDAKEVPPRFQRMAAEHQQRQWNTGPQRRGGGFPSRRGRGVRRARYWGNGRYYPDPPRHYRQEMIHDDGAQTEEPGSPRPVNRSPDGTQSDVGAAADRSFEVLKDSFDSGFQCGKDSSEQTEKSREAAGTEGDGEGLKSMAELLTDLELEPLGQPPTGTGNFVLLPPGHFTLGSGNAEVRNQESGMERKFFLGTLSDPGSVLDVGRNSDPTNAIPPLKRKSRLALKFPVMYEEQ